jgi:hypothetical protein
MRGVPIADTSGAWTNYGDFFTQIISN